MEYDVVVIGAGPSGLATAIWLKRLCQMHNTELSILVLEKGASVGANIISGCVLDPQWLNELVPNHQDLNFPLTTKVTTERLAFFTTKSSYTIPCPSTWKNKGNYIISLSQLCVHLAKYAEELGVEIYPGFAAAAPIIEDGILKGITTNDVGVDKNGEKTANYQPGIEIRAKHTVIAEGCRGSIAKQVIKKFNLDVESSPQTFGLGIKEIWQVDIAKHRPGHVLHGIGYPLNNQAYGGGFLYHFDKDLVAVGLVTSLDYENPYLNPYEEFQKFKQHPDIRQVLVGGKRLEYGARSVVEGGIQSLPKLSFAGGVLVGDSAGFLNVPKIKGVHNAIKSGMIAAKSVFEAIKTNHIQSFTYEQNFKLSPLYQELHRVRNVRPSFRLGLYFGLAYSWLDYYVFKGRAPWTFRYKLKDNELLDNKSEHKIIEYDKPDGIISFDIASSVHLANINHDENQPCHLKLASQNIPIQVNLINFAAPETRYCPAGVYEIVRDKDGHDKLHINAGNCVHCKACDIKDPTGNITWTPPEAGSGPQYSDM